MCTNLAFRRGSHHSATLTDKATLMVICTAERSIHMDDKRSVDGIGQVLKGVWRLQGLGGEWGLGDREVRLPPLPPGVAFRDVYEVCPLHMCWHPAACQIASHSPCVSTLTTVSACTHCRACLGCILYGGWAVMLVNLVQEALRDLAVHEGCHLSWLSIWPIWVYYYAKM